MSGYGISEWGVSGWGTGVGGLPVVAASSTFASGDKKVRITLSAEPLHSSSVRTGDALNPATWQVTVPQTGRVLTVIAVEEIDALTYDIYTWESFEPHQIQMLLSSSTLKDIANVPVGLIEASFYGNTLASTSTTTQLLATRGFALRDIRNPPTPNSPEGGTLEITSNGDYQSVTGEQFVRKLLIRRLISSPGDFKFSNLLDYGSGIVMNLKMPQSAASLVQLKKQIEQQIALEPEVAQSQVSLALDPKNNVLTVSVRARLKVSGNTVNVTLPLATA